jgi:predicted amidophosphoribosyltransferase
VSDPTRETTRWRRCSACKKDIPLGGDYWVCNVSTCNRKRTGLAFCSVECWEVHLPEANHRTSWAVEKTAPTTAEAPSEANPAAAAREPRRRIVSDAPARSRTGPGDDLPRDVLIVASRLKEYIRAKSGFNTSERVLGPLSDLVRKACDEAIRNAERSERKTVLDRDVPSP